MTYLEADLRFGELTTLLAANKSTDIVECLCDCGTLTSKVAFRLVAGTAKRCQGRNHGLSKTHNKMRSGRMPASISSASMPLLAASTRKPLSSRKRQTVWRMSMESSTTKASLDM